MWRWLFEKFVVETMLFTISSYDTAENPLHLHYIYRISAKCSQWAAQAAFSSSPAAVDLHEDAWKRETSAACDDKSNKRWRGKEKLAAAGKYMYWKLELKMVCGENLNLV